MANYQMRTYPGAPTQTKMSKGRFPTAYIHKMFPVSFSDRDMQKAKIRSLFIFKTQRKNTLSVLVIYLVPEYNNKGQLIAKTKRLNVRVNLVTNKVWQYAAKITSTVYAAPGWTHEDWRNEILQAVRKSV
jgi:hypothetical protein